jgi:hypothetical protein
VRRHPFRLGPASLEQPRRPGVPAVALGRGQRLIDRRPDQRVDEPKRRLGAQNIHPGQRDRRLGGGLVLQARQLGCLVRLGFVAQDRHRPRQPGRLRRQPREAHRHGARPGSRAQLTQAGHVLVGGGQALGGDRVDQLAQQQRIAARLLVAGGAEAVVGVGQALAHQPGGGRSAQGRGPDHGGERIGDDLADQARVGARLPAPQPHHHPDAQALHPGQQVGQPAQRGQVAPVQVVDGQQQPPAGGHIRGQPVQAVQARQRRIPVRLGRQAGRVKQRRGQPGRARQQLATLCRGQGGQQRLEQLADHAVGKRALQLRAACAKDLHPGRLRPRFGLRDQGGLADPGRPLERQQLPAGLGGADQAFDRRQLDLTLEQLHRRRDPLLGHRPAALLPRGPRCTRSGSSQQPTPAPATSPDLGGHHGAASGARRTGSRRASRPRSARPLS